MSERKIVDAKKDGNKIYFKGHAKATYLSDGRTVEDAINSNTGGSSGSVAYPKIKVTEGGANLDPNVFYVFGHHDVLWVEFNDPIDNIANEYLFQFDSEVPATSLLLPDTIFWNNDKFPTISENKRYQISVVEGIACFSESDLFFNFKIEASTYKAKLGMTWKDFVNSNLNTCNLSISNGIVCLQNEPLLYEWTTILENEHIYQDGYYTIENLQGGN